MLLPHIRDLGGPFSAVRALLARGGEIEALLET
jgi:hypothetical protein